MYYIVYRILRDNYLVKIYSCSQIFQHTPLENRTCFFLTDFKSDYSFHFLGLTGLQKHTWYLVE